VIGRLRKALSSAFGRGAEEKASPDEGNSDAGRRIEAAKRRLKKTIPPPED
jgi:hypothetical protein